MEKKMKKNLKGSNEEKMESEMLLVLVEKKDHVLRGYRVRFFNKKRERPVYAEGSR